MQIQQAFHECRAKERLALGGNQSGKTSAALSEVARAVTNQDPFDKYPKKGIAYIVGMEEKNIGEVIYPRLFESAFDIIRDEDTKLWRAYIPNQDQDRKSESELGPGWIPDRFIENIAWRDKAAKVPAKVFLTTGWEIRFFTGNSNPTRGTTVDLVLFDEEIANTDWYSEVCARLMKRGGKFIWDATPQTGTDQLLELFERSEELQGTPNPTTVAFEFSIFKNRYMGDEERIKFIETCPEDQKQVRVFGKFAILGKKYFPELSEEKHVIDTAPIPHHWTRYFALDPGYGKSGGLFMAVPEPDFSRPDAFNHGICYDELFMENATAMQFAEALRHKMMGQEILTFIIDDQHGQKMEVNGKKIRDQYEEAFEHFGLASQMTDSGFEPGSIDLDAGLSMIHQWLYLREGGTSKLKIMNCCVHLLRQLKTYKRKEIGGELVDKPQIRGKTELVDALRYLVQYNPVWVKPAPSKQDLAVPRFLASLRKRDAGSGHYIMGGG